MTWPKHVRIATVCTADRNAAVAMLATVKADVAEVRLDAFWPTPPEAEQASEDLITILEASPVPILATLRPKRQGGSYVGPEDVRINLLLAAAQAGCAVDLEDDHRDIGAVIAPFKAAGTDIIVSDHRFGAAPDRETGLKHLQSMQDLQVNCDKIAFPNGSFMDGLRALELAHSHAHRNGRPIIAPIGGDILLRAVLPLAGNHGTYGHAGVPAVSGQPAIADLQAIWDHWGLANDEIPGDADAGWYAVIGEPVKHSLSPRIHNAMLRADGAKQRYGALSVPNSIGAVRLIATVAARIGLRGASVTMPLKQHAAAVAYCDDMAKAVGAANCLRFTNGTEGTNTDATALRRLLTGAKAVAVLGAGGAARAALWAANDLGIPATFTCRDADKGAALAETMSATFVPWSERASLQADAWVQATPATDVIEALPGVERAIELVYKDGETSFTAAARLAGADVTDGRAFLVEQALDAYQYWTGRAGRREVMEQAL